MSTTAPQRVPAPAAMRWQWSRLSKLAVGDLYAVIAAQQQLEAFYASLGFRTVTAPFLEDGIPHVEMLHRGRAASAA